MSTITMDPMSAAPSSMAVVMLQRRCQPRQRFDSADYAMGVYQQRQRAAASRTDSDSDGSSRIPAPVVAPRSSSEDFSDWVHCDHEPEPETLTVLMEQQQQQQEQCSGEVTSRRLHRHRLQRFDSADWVVQGHQGYVSTVPSSADVVEGALAKMILDRHLYTTSAASSVTTTTASCLS